jgi:hypothetical protein
LGRAICPESAIDRGSATDPVSKGGQEPEVVEFSALTADFGPTGDGPMEGYGLMDCGPEAAIDRESDPTVA